MSELDVMKLRGLVLASAEGRSSADVIKHVRLNYERELAKVSEYLVDKALSAMLQSGARRKASVVLNDGFDIFGEFPLRGTRQVEAGSVQGKPIKRFVRLEHLTIAQAREEIARLDGRKLPEHKEAAVLRAMVAKAEKYGDEQTSIGAALQRAHQEES